MRPPHRQTPSERYRRQPVFAGKLDDPLSFGEKGGSGSRHNGAYLLLLGGLKGGL
jgi:hypothetical protein